MKVSHEEINLYGGRLEDKGSYTVFKVCTKKTVEETCALEELASDKQAIKLGVLFSPAFSQSERDNILEELSRKGYTQLQAYSLSQQICDYIKGHPYALILTAESDDLHIEYYDIVNDKPLSSILLPGAGKDPRVEVLAHCIWKKLVSEASYLSKDTDFEAVRETAKAFLSSGKSELDGTIYLEGENHDFFVRRRDANIDNLLDHGCASVLSSLSNFANQEHINKAETIMILSEGLANNSYFHDIFNGFTSDMKEFDEEWLKSILGAIMNDLNGISFSTNNYIGIDGLPLNNIKVAPSDTSIFFDILFPKGTVSIDIFRDENKIRTITEPQFCDSGLKPEHTYQYSFILTFKDENGYEKKAAESKIEVATTAISLPKPISLSIQQGDEEAILQWENPDKGQVRVYHSTRPFLLHENDVIKDLNTFDYQALSSLETNYHVKKDFCGERYFLPVTIIDNMGVAGEQVCVTSMVPPKGVRIDSTDINHVKAVWLWEDVTMVRIKWATEDGNERWQDVSNEGQAPEYEIPLPSLSRNFTVRVTSLYKRADGKVLESKEILQQVALSAVKVNFISAKSEARFFSHKDEYSVTLQADGEPPCDLYVLLEEGAIPLDLTNFKSHLTISHQELGDGKEKKFTLSYHRMQKKQPLYFRIIAADRNLPLKVVPETQKIK